MSQFYWISWIEKSAMLLIEMSPAKMAARSYWQICVFSCLQRLNNSFWVALEFKPCKDFESEILYHFANEFKPEFETVANEVVKGLTTVKCIDVHVTGTFFLKAHIENFV